MICLSWPSACATERIWVCPLSGRPMTPQSPERAHYRTIESAKTGRTPCGWFWHHRPSCTSTSELARQSHVRADCQPDGCHPSRLPWKPTQARVQVPLRPAPASMCRDSHKCSPRGAMETPERRPLTILSHSRTRGVPTDLRPDFPLAAGSCSPRQTVTATRQNSGDQAHSLATLTAWR